MKCGQSVFFDVYDFSTIPSELVSNIYENFKSDRSNGLYYTPIDVVDYILSKTLTPKLKQTDELKILDPSCGSGIFLIKSFKKLIASYDKITDVGICEILKSSIYGVDCDEMACDISILSIYFTLLDYIDDFTNFKFPYLKNKNIIVGDIFNSKLDNIGLFDVVLGNPPWFQAKGALQLFENYVIKNSVPISNRQIAEAFVPRICDFLKEDGVSSLMLTSKILYNQRDVKFRRYLLNKYNVLEIFDLTLIRKYLFKNSDWPSFILTFKKGKSDVINHVSINVDFNLKYLNKLDLNTSKHKKVSFKDLIRYDWLFKTLLVGDWDDFNLIKRLKSENISLGEFILKHPHLKDGVGFKKSLKKTNKDASQFLNKPLICLKNGDLKRYSVTASDKWRDKYLRSGNVELVKPPFLLMKGSFTADFDFIASYCDKEIIFDYNVYAIKGRKCDEMILKNLVALINSDLFKYFFYMTGNVGVEKNKSSFKERKNFPLNWNIVDNKELYDLVLVKEQNIGDESIDERINKVIYEAYDLSLDEIDLVRMNFN